jgi:uncharacterized repeat protein (TIGR01451 family)
MGHLNDDSAVEAERGGTPVIQSNRKFVDRSVVGTTLALALLAASLAVAGCCAVKSGGAAHAAEPAKTEHAEKKAEASRPGALQRPDLPADWNWSGQALPTGEVATSLITLEHFAPAKANANTEYQYTIRVKNVSPSMHLADVVVTDHMPASGFKFASANPAADPAGGTLTWKAGNLEPGETRSFVVRGAGTAEGVARECSSVAYTPMVCVETTIVSAGLELKQITPAEVLQNQDIPLRLVVRNPGTGDATAVKVVDQLPEGWTVAGKNTATFDVGTLKAGESRELTAVARAPKTGSFVNRASATAAGDLKVEAAAGPPIVVKKPATLEITKTASSATEVLSRQATFTIAVHNTGEAPAEDFVITDAMTGADKIVSASDGGTISGNTITWKAGALAAGATKTVKVTASRDTAGTLSDTATAAAKGAESVTATAQVAYQGIAAVLLELVDSPDPIAIGETTTYTIKVTNQGTAPDSEVVVTCAFEDAVEFVSAAGVTQGVHEGKTVKFAPLATLAPKESVKWTVVVKGIAEADTRFTTTLNTKETGRPIVTNEATRVYK